MLQLTEALVFLHGRDLVHRQLSSHAVQMVSCRRARLGQLECTARVGAQCVLKTQPGWRSLVPWVAPELLEAEVQQASPVSDVYSFCCILWEVSTGSVPWAGLTSTQVVRGGEEGG